MIIAIWWGAVLVKGRGNGKESLMCEKESLKQPPSPKKGSLEMKPSPLHLGLVYSVWYTVSAGEIFTKLFKSPLR